jgi:hypothetical protein
MSAKPSYFISVVAQGSTDRFREWSIEHADPEPSGDAKALVDPTGAVFLGKDQNLFDETSCRSEPNPFCSTLDDGGLAFELFGNCLSPLFLSYPLE